MFKYIVIVLLMLSPKAFGASIELDNKVQILRGQVSETSVSKLIYEISKLEGDTVTLFIRSPGGSVLSGSKLIEYMKSSEKKFTCIADFAASMAFTIFINCDERIVLSTGILMQHVSSWGLEGQDPNNRQFLNLIYAMVDKLETDSAKKLDMSFDEYKKFIRDDVWLYGSQGTKHKIATKVQDVQCQKGLSEQTETETYSSMFGSATLTWSRCPLVSQPVTSDMTLADEFDTTKWSSSFIKDVNNLRLRK